MIKINSLKHLTWLNRKLTYFKIFLKRFLWKESSLTSRVLNIMQQIIVKNKIKLKFLKNLKRRNMVKKHKNRTSRQRLNDYF